MAKRKDSLPFGVALTPKQIQELNERILRNTALSILKRYEK